MSSKRHIKRKACLSKIRYETWEAAMEARHLLQTGRKGYTGPMNVYHCVQSGGCGGFHIGHASRKQLVKRAAQMENKG